MLAPLDRASSLPAACYFDPEVFALERAAIFERAWLCAGRDDELAAPGAWRCEPLTDEGILLVRGADLACRGFYNVCRHRASPLVAGAAGRAAEIRCPYHGWTYELSGALREAPGTEGIEGFAREEQGLSPVRAGAWKGFSFVSLDPAAPPLEEHLSTPPPRLARAGLDHLRLGRRVEYTTAANWKLCVENFQESHHFPGVHPGLERLTPAARAESVLSDGPWLGGVMDLAGGAETVSLDGRLHGRPLLAGTRDDERRQVFDALLFPTLLLSLQPDYLLTYRLIPTAPAETRVIADIHFHPAAFIEGFDPVEVFTFWDRVNAEDRWICERQQIGVRSRGYAPGRFARVEDGVHAFDRLVARRYLEATAEDR